MNYKPNVNLHVKQDKMISSSYYDGSKATDQNRSSLSHLPTGSSAPHQKNIPGLPLYILYPEKARTLQQNFFSIGFPISYGAIDLPIKPTQTITKFQDPTIQDPLEWCKTFRRVAVLNQWINETSLLILQDLIDEKYLIQLESKKTLDTKLDLLCEILFPYKDFNLYRKALTQVKRFSFSTFNEYVKALEDIRRRADLCGQKSQDKIPERDIIDVIIENLTFKERSYLSTINAHTLEEIQTGIQNYQENQVYFNLSETSSKEKTNNEIPRKPKQYCYYHKTTFHDAKDCKYLQSKGKSNENHKQVCSVSKSESKISQPSFPMTCLTTQDLPVNLLIDTGACKNFISENYIKKHLSDVEQKGVNEEIILADGSKAMVTKKIEIKGKLDFDDTFRNYEFFVLPNLPYDGILGIESLASLNCSLQLEKGKISIKTCADSDPDSLISNKSELPFLSDSVFKSQIQHFVDKNPKIGRINTNPMKIHLSNTIPVCKRPYTISLPRIEDTKKEINKLLEMNIIRESKSAYASPAFPIPKKNGKTRLVVDYKELNSKTIKLGYPFPNMQYSLIDLKGAKYFSQLDLNMGYYQIPMAEESIEKTAFVTPFGHYEFLRMPFGLSNAPRVFQQVMTSKLKQFPFAKVFVDDILIFSPCYESHKTHVIQVLQHLLNEGISINFEKSSFLKNEVKYLGKIINKDGIRADLDSLCGIEKFQTPKNKTHLMKLLGKLNWFREHVPNLSNYLINITAKLKQTNSKFTWTREDENALDSVIKIIKSQIILHHPDLDKEFVLKTDASDEGVGALLYQEEKLVGIYSNKLKAAEKNYTTTEKELLAIIKALKHFKSIILGTRIKVLTDHKNLTYITTCENNRAQRWKILLDEFNVELEYIEGKRNIEADMFSRCMLLTRKEEKDLASKCLNKLEKKSGHEKEGENEPAKFPSNYDELNRRIIHPAISEKLVQSLHRHLGHPGRNKLFNTLNKALNIQNLGKIVEYITRFCKTCQTQKNTTSRKGKLIGQLTADRPFQRISIDLYGPLDLRYFKKETTHEKIMLVVIIDIYSRLTEIIPTKSISAKTMVKIVQTKWIEKYGAPTEMISDQGKQFIATHFKDFLAKQNIKQILSSSYNPTGNSIVERANQTIGNVLRCSKNGSLKQAIKFCKRNLNQTYHSVLGMSPFEVVKQQNPINSKLKVTVSHEQIKSRKEKRSQDDLEKRNKLRTYIEYKKGDQVLIKTPFPDKLDTRWKGPFAIVEVSHKNYLLVKIRGETIRVNVKRTKPFKREEHVVE
ncbi:Transposon Tf2-9 polyprotein [Nosema granulosis]|uniref:RNA-directed DNA polymerase n=1 Tax=Nosema granulosis TaxID=83296 RepID=A0A9P6GW79_9MICR|nr:Transposon Tf2-9 polyprotein [Nosema granulosis]